MKKTLIGIFLLIFITVTGCGLIDSDNNDITKETPEVNEPDTDDENVNQEKEPKDEEPVEKESYLESTVEINSEGLKVVTNPSDISVLVNKDRNLPYDYEPEDLIDPEIPFVQGQDSPVRFMREEAGVALREMFAKAKEEGFIFYGRSGYRSYKIQKILFDSYVELSGEEAANKYSARAGQSEHQTGLAMDVTSEVVGNKLTEKFGETEDGKWIKENAHEFGFIVRYPKGKEDITGYQYEPWHLRYVGKKVATEIYELDITLEEYFRDYYNQ